MKTAIAKMVTKSGFVALFALGLGGSAFAANQYGSLAYDVDSKSYGWAVDYPTQAAANKRALSECGSECSVVLEFQNTCAAFSMGSDAYGFAIGETRAAAETAAEDACDDKSSEDDCLVKVWGCTRK